MSLPFFELPETEPAARGRHHGKVLARQVRSNAEICYRRFENGGLDRPGARRAAQDWTAWLAARVPRYVEEMAGIAAGAGVEPVDVAAINFRFEIGFPLMAERALRVRRVREVPDGCTSFVLSGDRAADGHLRIGQTLDGVAAIGPNLAVLLTSRPDGGRILAVHEAGSVGPSLGINAAGLGVAYNSLITPACTRPEPGLPFRARMLGVLEAGSFADALHVALSAPRPTATHLLIAHRGGDAVSVELARRLAAVAVPEDGVLTHANHMEHLSGVESLFERLLPDSLARSVRLRTLLTGEEGPVDDRVVRSVLADHSGFPDSVCQHGDPEAAPERRGMTLAAAVMDPASGTLAVTGGPPCSSPYVAFTLRPQPASP